MARGPPGSRRAESLRRLILIVEDEPDISIAGCADAQLMHRLAEPSAACPSTPS
jgi:hypothetical protein